MTAVTIFFGVFIGIGVLVLCFGIWSAWQAVRPSRWPTTRGIVRQVSLQEKPGDEGGTLYHVDVEYSYQVGGSEYSGTRLAFGYNPFIYREEQDEICQRLNQAKSVAVRYNPLDPTVSCLSFGVHRSVRLLLAFACVWLLFVCGMILIAWLFSRHDDVLLEHLLVR